MTNYKDLDYLYKQLLEEDIINYLAEFKNIDTRKAFDIYYSSELAKQIEENKYGIENLDPKYLANDLIENESELFK